MARKTQFSVDFSKAIDREIFKAEETVRLTVIGLFTKIVFKTPRDTGYLAYNWQVSSNNPITNVKGVRPEEKNAFPDNVALAKDIESELKNYNMSNLKSFWLANNVEYAEDIEYGRSGQAPEGMVRVTLREFDDIFKGAFMKVNKGTGSKGNRYY